MKYWDTKHHRWVPQLERSREEEKTIPYHDLNALHVIIMDVANNFNWFNWKGPFFKSDGIASGICEACKPPNYDKVTTLQAAANPHSDTTKYI